MMKYAKKVIIVVVVVVDVCVSVLFCIFIIREISLFNIYQQIYGLGVVFYGISTFVGY